MHCSTRSEEAARIDRWLFFGDPVERWARPGFHSPAHAAAVANVSALLSRWCREHPGYRTFGYDCPYVLARSPVTLVTFDASITKPGECEPIRDTTPHIEGIPSLAVEVVERGEDPETLAWLVQTVLRHRVGAMWVVDPWDEVVVDYRVGTEPQRLGMGMTVSGPVDLSGLQCSVAEIFE